MAVGVSRSLLHELLWERRYGDDLVTVNQAELAGVLCVTRPTMNRIVGKMIDEERLAQEGDQLYRVYDPAAFDTTD